MVVFDCSDQSSFDEVENWLQRVQQFAPRNSARLLVGVRKSGCERVVTSAAESRLAAKYGIPCCEWSDDGGTSAEAVFAALVREIDRGSDPPAVVTQGCMPSIACSSLVCPVWPGLWSSLGWAQEVPVEPWKAARTGGERVQTAEIVADVARR